MLTAFQFDCILVFVLCQVELLKPHLNPQSTSDRWIVNLFKLIYIVELYCHTPHLASTWYGTILVRYGAVAVRWLSSIQNDYFLSRSKNSKYLCHPNLRPKPHGPNPNLDTFKNTHSFLSRTRSVSQRKSQRHMIRKLSSQSPRKNPNDFRTSQNFLTKPKKFHMLIVKQSLFCQSLIFLFVWS